MFFGSGPELPLPGARLPASKIHLDLEDSLLSPGCHPYHHARLQKLFRYVFPAVHFNFAEDKNGIWPAQQHSVSGSTLNRMNRVLF